MGQATAEHDASLAVGQVLRVAAILSGLSTLLLLEKGIGILLPALFMNLGIRPIVFGMALAFLGVALGFAGYSVWIGELLGVQIGLGVSTLAAALLWFIDARLSLGLIATLAVVPCLAFIWMRRRGRTA